jgi:DNA polymerase-3 subunit gamma/tau
MAKKKPAAEAPPTTQPAAPGADSSGNDYTVLARRYRPGQFSELVGQEAVAQALSNALSSNRVAHAYLFTGTRGVGKTSAARILAKALNCEKGPTPTPCDQCINCKSIAGGDDQDVLEIDGASNNGVDNIRELRQNVQYRPTRSRYKIYIIDEVHMLSTAAFNALLKTLEEPPPSVKFIFATTEIQKVPVTILSRCQRFDFGGISLPRILARLKEIVAAEGKQADDEALELIARRAGGSMRDGQSLLDQLLSFSAERLTVDGVHQLLGTAHEERVMAIADAVLARDIKRALQVLTDILDQGQQLGELLDQLIEYWRDLMVVNCAGLEGQSLSVTSARRGQLQQHASQTNLDTILTGMDILVTAKSRLRFTSQGRTVLEMSLVRLAQLDTLMPIAQMAQWLNQEGAPAPAAARLPSPAPRVFPGPTVAAAGDAEKKKLNPDKTAITPTACLPLRDDNIQVIWQQVIDNSGFAIRAELQKVKSLAISGPNALVLRVSRRYNLNGMFMEPARSAKIEEQLSALTGQRCSLKVEWLDELAADADAPNQTATPPPGQQRQIRAGLLQVPFVKQLADVLNAQIVRAEDGFGTAKAPAPAPAETDTGVDDVPNQESE